MGEFSASNWSVAAQELFAQSMREQSFGHTTISWVT